MFFADISTPAQYILAFVFVLIVIGIFFVFLLKRKSNNVRVYTIDHGVRYVQYPKTKPNKKSLKKEKPFKSYINLNDLSPDELFVYSKMSEVFIEKYTGNDISSELKIVENIRKVPAICWKNCFLIDKYFLTHTAERFLNAFGKKISYTPEAMELLKTEIGYHANFIISTRRSIMQNIYFG